MPRPSGGGWVVSSGDGRIHTVRTVCRVCESACGVVATVDGDRVTRLAPDRQHPISRGLACAKGLQFHAVHHGDSRLRRPWLRGQGETDWASAMGRLGDRLRTILDTWGPESVGVFSGNAAGHSLGSVLGVTALQRGLGTSKHYSCLTLDNAPMYPVLEACLGSPLLTFVADYGASDCIVLIGTDPLSSQPGQAQSHPRGVVDLRAAGPLLTVVDPRESSTARRAAHHLAPVPGTDVRLLAWLLREAVAVRGGPEALRGALAAVDDDVLDPCGLPAGAARALSDRLLAAQRPLVWCGLGVLLSAHGTVGYWLTLALQATLAGLDTEGGWRLQRGCIDLPRVGRWLGLRGLDREVRSRIGGFPSVLGTVASATLADDVLSEGAERLRALIVVGGNPLVSLPDTTRAEQALRSLDLLVCVDLRINETGALSDAVLPARSWLARAELAIHTTTQRPVAHLDDVPAAVAPVGEAREDLDIACALVRAAGRHPFGSRMAAAAVDRLGAVGLARCVLAVAPRARSSELKPSLDVPWLLEGLAQALQPLGGRVDGFRLVTSVRAPRTMNSWLRTGRVAVPVLRLHPDDHAVVGARVQVVGPAGTVVVAAVADPAVRRGVAVWPFGWSEVNPNQVLGTDRLEPVTGQPISNGAVVQLRPAAEGGARRGGATR